MKRKIEVLLKGFVIGGTMLVPGVSGGTMAIILGIYDKLVKSVSQFLKQKKESTIFLGLFCIGAFVGMSIFAKNILNLLNMYYMPMMYFFVGAVIGGIPIIVKSCKVKKFKLDMIFYVLLGIVVVMGISAIPENLFSPRNINSLGGVVILFFAGFLAAIALILPGISVSFVLLVLGIYDEIIVAFDQFNVLYLGILGIGLIIGIISSTRLLENTMTKHPKGTYLIILGFVIGSVIPVFPGIPSGIDWLICPICLVVGFILIHILSKFDNQ